MNKWNNKFRYQVASCWLFILSYTAMHGSMNIKCNTYCFSTETMSVWTRRGVTIYVHSYIKHRTKGAKSFFTFLFGTTFFFCKCLITCPRRTIVLQDMRVPFWRNPKASYRNRRNLSPVETRTRRRGGPVWQLPPGAPNY